MASRRPHRRPRVDEILAWRARSGASVKPYLACSRRIGSIERLLKAAKKLEDERDQKEILRYFPVAVIACLEGLVVRIAADLINKNDAVRRNIDKWEISIDWLAMQSIHNGEVTIGEYVAHTRTINKLGDIESILSVMLGIEDYVYKMKTHRTQVRMVPALNVTFTPDGKFIASEMIPDDVRDIQVPLFNEAIDEVDWSMTRSYFSECTSSVAQAFEIRHILAHELAVDVDLDEANIGKMVQSVELYALATTLFADDYLRSSYESAGGGI